MSDQQTSIIAELSQNVTNKLGSGIETFNALPEKLQIAVPAIAVAVALLMLILAYKVLFGSSRERRKMREEANKQQLILVKENYRAIEYLKQANEANKKELSGRMQSLQNDVREMTSDQSATQLHLLIDAIKTGDLDGLGTKTAELNEVIPMLADILERIDNMRSGVDTSILRDILDSSFIPDAKELTSEQESINIALGILVKLSELDENDFRGNVSELISREDIVRLKKLGTFDQDKRSNIEAILNLIAEQDNSEEIVENLRNLEDIPAKSIEKLLMLLRAKKEMAN